LQNASGGSNGGVEFESEVGAVATFRREGAEISRAGTQSPQSKLESEEQDGPIHRGLESSDLSSACSAALRENFLGFDGFSTALNNLPERRELNQRASDFKQRSLVLSTRRKVHTAFSRKKIQKILSQRRKARQVQPRRRRDRVPRALLPLGELGVLARDILGFDDWVAERPHESQVVCSQRWHSISSIPSAQLWER
jgi:hypothetical protein